MTAGGTLVEQREDRGRGHLQEGDAEVTRATSPQAQLEHRAVQQVAGAGDGVQGVRVGSWQQHRFFWSCRLQDPRGGTSHGSWLTVCFLGNLYHCRVAGSEEISGCRADISTPPSCLSPPCFISKQHIRGWCLASRGAQGTGLAFSWGTFERLLAGP